MGQWCNGCQTPARLLHGGCPGATEACIPDGLCVDVCRGRQCGTVGEFHCGTCQGSTEVCTSAGQCADLCENRQCGPAGPMACGGCSAGQVCSTGGHCYTPGTCPAGTVEVEGMGACIEAFEYTIERFAAFLNQHGNECPADNGTVECYTSPPRMDDQLYWETGLWTVAPGREAYPMFEVSWYGARQACLHEGRRLCTLAEWVAACRGPEDRAFPYGNEYDESRCNTCVSIGVSGYCPPNDSYEPVGSLPGCEGGYPGLFDMIGNVDEWVEDLYGTDQNSRYLKGGAYLSLEITGYLCDWSGNTGASPFLIDTVGFRCCMTLE